MGRRQWKCKSQPGRSRPAFSSPYVCCAAPQSSCGLSSCSLPKQRFFLQAAEQRAAAEAIAARAPARRLAKAILDRGWRVGLPQLSVGALLVPCRPAAAWCGPCSAWVRTWLSSVLLLRGVAYAQRGCFSSTASCCCCFLCCLCCTKGSMGC